MNKNRILFIDNLRAFSLIGVVIIHVFSFHLTNVYTTTIWNFLEFVVAAFIFCSGFVSAHYEMQVVNLETTLHWYKKRFMRLYMPFLLYFLIHYTLFLFFPLTFTHFGIKKDVGFLISSLVLMGGANTNWLPLVFIELTFLTPLLFFLSQRKKLWVYFTISFLITLAFTIFTFPYNSYRLVMWIPWSLILLMGIKLAQQTKITKNAWKISAGCLGVFSVSFILLTSHHRSLLFYDNKYPPTLFYLSFGYFVTFLLTIFLSTIKFGVYAQKALLFISKNSYALFFIHYIILDFLESTIISKYLIAEILTVCITSAVVFFLLKVFKSYFLKIYFLSANTTVRSE